MQTKRDKPTQIIPSVRRHPVRLPPQKYPEKMVEIKDEEDYSNIGSFEYLVGLFSSSVLTVNEGVGPRKKKRKIE